MPPIRVRVLAKRPSSDYGELHGLYEPEEGRAQARITVWMRTAQRQQVVAFRSFLRTLVHEIGHHLDYEMYKLEETFHTDGFYKRESTLSNALIALMAVPPPPARSRTRTEEYRRSPRWRSTTAPLRPPPGPRARAAKSAALRGALQSDRPTRAPTRLGALRCNGAR